MTIILISKLWSFLYIIEKHSVHARHNLATFWGVPYWYYVEKRVSNVCHWVIDEIYVFPSLKFISFDRQTNILSWWSLMSLYIFNVYKRNNLIFTYLINVSRKSIKNTSAIKRNEKKKTYSIGQAIWIINTKLFALNWKIIPFSVSAYDQDLKVSLDMKKF